MRLCPLIHSHHGDGAGLGDDGVTPYCSRQHNRVVVHENEIDEDMDTDDNKDDPNIEEVNM